VSDELELGSGSDLEHLVGIDPCRVGEVEQDGLLAS